MLRFGYTADYVTDVDATLACYEHAFGLRRRFITPDGAYGELETGKTALGFASLAVGEAHIPGGVRPLALGDTPPALEVALVTDDVPAAFARAVEAGAAPLADRPARPLMAAATAATGPVKKLLETRLLVEGYGAGDGNR